MLIASRGLAAATVAVVAVLFVTAGSLVQSHSLESVHGAAAIALHVTTGLLTVSLAVLARARERGWWAVGVSAAAFAYSFLQAYLGSTPTLYLHVPGALLVTAASVWLAVWVFGRQPATAVAG